jgi:predicted O-linked N-acetylglucosamine transferase (SPINDLY family)
MRPLATSGAAVSTTSDLLSQAKAIHRAGQSEAAETLYLQVLQADPENVEAPYFLGALYQSVGRLHDALAKLQQAVTRRPNHADSYNHLGVVLAQLGRADDALASFRQALQIRPNYEDARFNLLKLVNENRHVGMEWGDPNSSIAVPGAAEKFNRLGVALARQGRINEAMANFQRAVQLEPDNAQVCNNLGIALAQQGKIDEAAICFHRAVRVRPDFAEAHNNLGNVFNTQSKAKEALACYQRALELRPDFTAARDNLAALHIPKEQNYQAPVHVSDRAAEANQNGIAAIKAGRVDEAEAAFRQALQIRPDLAAAHNNLGTVLRLQTKLAEAEKCFQKALNLQPNYIDALSNLGVVLAEQNRLDEAVACFQKTVQLQPDYTSGHNNLGNVLKSQRKLAAAAACFRTALRLNPNYFEAHNNLGALLHDEEGKTAEAIACYEQALKLNPNYAEAHNNLGLVQKEQGKLDAAAASCRRALQLKPDLAEAHSNLGAILKEQGQLAEAVDSCKRALQLKPEFADGHNNLGNALMAQGCFDEAITCFKQAVRIKPDSATGQNNLGNALTELQRFDEAAVCYDRALQLQPNYNDGHVNRALLWLRFGDFAQGWPEYEWRLKTKAASANMPPEKVWDGTPLPGKSILLHAEQGLGDTIQFVRYAAKVKKLGMKVILECQEPLLKLLAGTLGVDRLITRGMPRPAFNAHAPLLSLPGILKTNLSNIPVEIPYISAASALIERWRAKFRPIQGFKIGISWQGSRSYLGDRQRSIRLAEFAPLAQVPNVHLISLQKGAGTEQITEVKDQVPVLDLSKDLDEAAGPFMDTAAIMKNLDLIITSDTAVAHLAGALGVPVWVALPFTSDWRWLLDRNDSPWYPTMRLFRQQQRGKWNDVFTQMAGELQRRASQPIHAERAEVVAAKVQQSATVKPQDARALNSQGIALAQQGKLYDAVVCLQQAVQLLPEFAEAHNNLGGVFNLQGKSADAIACFQKALHLKPDLADAHNNFGSAWGGQGKLAEAEKHFKEAVRLKPGFRMAVLNLGNVLKDQGKLDQAADCFRRAIGLDPNRADAYFHLGNALAGQGRLNDAVNNYRLALGLEPDNLQIVGALVYQLQHICLWQDQQKLCQQISNLLDKSTRPGIGLRPFTFLVLPLVASAEQQFHCARQWSEESLGPWVKAGQQAIWHRPKRNGSKITVGYLSADFRAHATAYLVAELFEKHDRRRFNIIGYSLSGDDGSPMRQRLEKGLRRFVNLGNLGHEEAAGRIAADGVDILVDLMGYTRGSHPQILALRPAPIQVNYLGFPGTMGASFMDYILVDNYVVPPEQQPFFSEQLVHLPGCYQINDRKREIAPNTPDRATCGLPAEGFVFCSFNNNYKITPQVFDVWMRLLRAVPGSVLWLLEGNAFAPANLRREAEARGVAADRLVFAPKKDLPEHLARHRLADLFLDTFPVNAHTTASDALWAGLPVVTMPGETFVSRVAGSLLRALGLRELIAANLGEYETLALRLATDKTALAKVRAKLARNKKKSPVFDGAAFARNLENAYSAMWRIHAAGEEPRPITVRARG